MKNRMPRMTLLKVLEQLVTATGRGRKVHLDGADPTEATELEAGVRMGYPAHLLLTGRNVEYPEPFDYRVRMSEAFGVWVISVKLLHDPHTWDGVEVRVDWLTDKKWPRGGEAAHAGRLLERLVLEGEWGLWTRTTLPRETDWVRNRRCQYCNGQVVPDDDAPDVSGTGEVTCRECANKIQFDPDGDHVPQLEAAGG